MKRYLTLFLLAVVANLTFGQSLLPTESKGTQANEEVTQTPRIKDAPAVNTQPWTESVSKDVHKEKINRKKGLKDFVVNRASKRVQKLLPVTAMKSVKDDGRSLLYVLLVILLILIILNLIADLLPFYFTGILITVLLIILLFWLLGWL